MHGIETYQSNSLTTSDKERLVIQYMQLVRYVAQRLISRLPANVELEDLVNAGILGLLDAVEKYDPGRKTQFKTYAEFRVRGAILDELRNLDWVPRSVREKAHKLDDVYQALENRLGRPAEDEEVAAELDMDMDEYYRFVDSARAASLINLDELGVREEDQKYILEVLADPNAEDPFDAAGLAELKSITAGAISDLPERERVVLLFYYQREMTMKEIAQALELTESRVSQIHTQAICRVRAKLRKLIV